MAYEIFFKNINNKYETKETWTSGTLTVTAVQQKACAYILVIKDTAHRLKRCRKFSCYARCLPCVPLKPKCKPHACLIKYHLISFTSVFQPQLLAFNSLVKTERYSLLLYGMLLVLPGYCHSHLPLGA